MINNSDEKFLMRRQERLNTYFEQLLSSFPHTLGTFKAVQALTEPHRLNIALVGERHSGKTSLINEIQCLVIKNHLFKKIKSNDNSQSPSRKDSSMSSKKLQVKLSTKWKED